jgi:glycosyltransferase involved in cell wall biosynthesis
MRPENNPSDVAVSLSGKKVSVIFSFRNEEDVLVELITRVRKALGGERNKGFISGFELIFVNDRSTDRSEEILKEMALDHRDIKILNMSKTFGVSPCVMAGFKWATGDIIVYMDADLQDPPEVIPEMLVAWRTSGKNIDIVHTVRSSRSGESFLKRRVTKIGYWVLGKMSNMTEEAGDFKLLSRRAVDHIIQFNEYNPFMRGLVSWVGFNQESIYYNREIRFAGETKFPVFSRKVLSNFFNSALISFSGVPLQLASLAGIGGFIISVGMIFLVLFKKFQGVALPGWTVIMTAVLFIGSLQLLAIGILGLYIKSIFIEVKRRPNFIIESVYGFDEIEMEELQAKFQENNSQMPLSIGKQSGASSNKT